MLKFFIFCILFNYFTTTTYTNDQVTTLPGLNDTINFKHYSGYLDAGSTKLHYWFVESQNNPETDPLILWLNGGPGCSSLDGLLSELGPFHIKDSGQTLYLNPYSWNNVKSPAGVGFSYAEDDNYLFDDDKVSLNNYQAIKYFFEKYPRFSKNPFFVIGESYGGIYVPTLTKRILQDMPIYDLQGFAIGNGLLSVTMNDQSVMYFAYYHTIIGQKLWDELLSFCCSNALIDSKDDLFGCNFTVPANPQCLEKLKLGWRMIFYSGINDYSLYRPCDPVVDSYTSPSTAVGLAYLERFLKFFSPPSEIKTYLRESIYRNNNNNNLVFPINQNDVLKNESSDESQDLRESVPCIDSSALVNWLNREDVKEALHINSKSAKWDVCSLKVGETYRRLYENMSDQFKYILNYHKSPPIIHEDISNNNLLSETIYNNTRKQPIRGLVYNGDTDLMCNFLGAEWFLLQLGLPQNGEHEPWYSGKDKQVAGFVDYYDNLVFATVKGAGHMVPQWKPKEAYHMIQRFLQNKPL